AAARSEHRHDATARKLRPDSGGVVEGGEDHRVAGRGDVGGADARVHDRPFGIARKQRGKLDAGFGGELEGGLTRPPGAESQIDDARPSQGIVEGGGAAFGQGNSRGKRQLAGPTANRRRTPLSTPSSPRKASISRS